MLILKFFSSYSLIFVTLECFFSTDSRIICLSHELIFFFKFQNLWIVSKPFRSIELLVSDLPKWRLKVRSQKFPLEVCPSDQWLTNSLDFLCFFLGNKPIISHTWLKWHKSEIAIAIIGKHSVNHNVVQIFSWTSDLWAVTRTSTNCDLWYSGMNFSVASSPSSLFRAFQMEIEQI